MVDNDDDTDNDADSKNFNFVGCPLDLVLQVNDQWLHLHHHKLPQELKKEKKIGKLFGQSCNFTHKDLEHQFTSPFQKTYKI